jgi:hypothetical protein
MQLRWLIRRNPVTVQQVKAYADKFCMPMFEARKKLVNEQPPVLQYLDSESFDIDRGDWGLWVDVPTVMQSCNPKEQIMQDDDARDYRHPWPAQNEINELKRALSKCLTRAEVYYTVLQHTPAKLSEKIMVSVDAKIAEKTRENSSNT